MARKGTGIGAVIVILILLAVVGGVFFLGNGSGREGIQIIQETIFQTTGQKDSGVVAEFDIVATVSGNLNCAAAGDSVFVDWAGSGETLGSLSTVKSDWDLQGNTYTLDDPALNGDIGETIWVTIDVPVIPFSITHAFLLNADDALFDFGTVFNCL